MRNKKLFQIFFIVHAIRNYFVLEGNIHVPCVSHHYNNITFLFRLALDLFYFSLKLFYLIAVYDCASVFLHNLLQQNMHIFVNLLGGLALK